METTKRKFRHKASGYVLMDVMGNGIFSSPYLKKKWSVDEAERDFELEEITYVKQVLDEE